MKAEDIAYGAMSFLRGALFVKNVEMIDGILREHPDWMARAYSNMGKYMQQEMGRYSQSGTKVADALVQSALTAVGKVYEDLELDLKKQERAKRSRS